jgi:hypothetical protein
MFFGGIIYANAAGRNGKVKTRNTLFRRQYQYLLSRIGLEPPHLFQFTKKKDRPRGLKTPRKPGTPKTHENLGERFNTKRQTLTPENDTSVLLLWHCRSRAFPAFSAFSTFPAFSNGRSFSSGSLFNQPNAPEHGPEFLPSLLAKFRAPYQFADQQRIVT